MSRLSRYFLVVFVSTASTALYAQGYFHTKTLLDSAELQNRQVIILKETDSFIISTPLKIFADDLVLFIKNNHNNEDKKLLLLFSKNTNAKIHAESIVKTNIQRSRLLFRTASLLQSGHCMVYNKLNKQNGKTFTIEKFRTDKLKVRKFKNKDGLIILETRDAGF